MDINIGTILFTSAAGTAVGGAIVGFVFKEVFKNEIEKNRIKYTHELNLDIEDFKADEDRKNLITESYVNIVTRERIKWLEVVRINYSELKSRYSIIKFHINHQMSWGMVQFLSILSSDDGIKSFMEKNDLDYKNFVISMEKKEIELSKFIESITLLKLRLNPQEDLKIIELLDNLQELIVGNKPSSQVEQIINELDDEISNMLKKEWNKVKDEVRTPQNFL